MNTGIVKSKASGLALMGKVLVGVMVLGMVPQGARAATSNVQFEEYITYICAVLYGAGAPTQEIADMCSLTSTGFAGPAATASVNLGTANAGSSVVSRKKKGVGLPLDEQKDQPEKGASADGGGWGFLVTPLYGKGERPETDLENGYKSDLTGLNIGLDYRFSDSFLLGGIIGHIRDKADFLNSAGSLKTSNITFTLYGTWLPSESSAVDGYLGYGKLNFDSQRKVVWGTSISGTTSGTTTGNQLMGGISASYQKDIGRFNLSPFINLDYIKTSFKGYNETGTTTLEMHYGDRSTTSFTSSLGVRVGASYGYEWGTFVPSARLATVREFQNNTQQISNELVITPGVNFSVATDAPDRNYLNIGFGVSAALDSGTQLFLDYEKRTQDKLLNSWAVSLGALMEF
ncbi:MAG: autotransporter outer membrane beta-barrel domain-containing protein [Sideroxyarcus sp.]|nr:autotransporter outer membrane beta-barrel domain-containing protein [Sideroxyarcus sp.]